MVQQDFTKGDIYSQLVRFSTPIMLTNVLQVSYQFIDSLWVGNLLGANALGAIAVAGTVIFTVLSFIIGINNASLTILSQQKGMDSNEGLRRYLNAFTVLQLFLSILLGIGGYFFAEPILKLLDTPSEMVGEAAVYLQINFVWILFVVGYNFISTILRSLGDSRTPLYIVLGSVVLNAVLDPLFIKGFDLGLAGAAYATVLSQGVAFLAGLGYILVKKLAPFPVPYLPDQKEVSVILKLGIPAGLQMVVISAGVMAIMSVVNSLGAAATAGFGAAQRLDSIIMIPAQALGTAVNSMAGQNIGAGRWDRVQKIAIYGTIYNLAVMFLIAAATFLFARSGIRLFIDDPDAVDFGEQYLKIIAFTYPFLGINFILNGVVRGAGAMMQVLVLNIISFWVLRYPLTELFTAFLGEKGVATGMGTSFAISSVIAFLYFKYGKWRKKELFND
ncbi:MATE family efflux transporter [Bacillus sp. FJAT-27225]|uniref:MATE family efflux transporter n=1 Tax=Bacillus sp. FJAT-27225 TaxID=1743144 RepID=UPI00080C28ED|nr:MATE family efflux transporter [Bacillus sp. FJAT-27225]OCA90716.1 MATE family efflux transporter [Bacillus sp. FJAT-27225]